MVLSRVAAQKGYLPESLDGTFKITEPYSHLVGAKMAKSALSIVTPVIFMWDVGASTFPRHPEEIKLSYNKKTGSQHKKVCI